MNRQIESVHGVLHWLAVCGIVPAALSAALVYVRAPQLLSPRGAPVSPSEETRGEDRYDQRGRRTGSRARRIAHPSGIPAAELRGLDVADVDLTNCTAIVTGTDNEQCVVPIGKTALRLLESYLRGVRLFRVARHERACAVAHARGKTAVVGHALGARPSSR